MVDNFVDTYVLQARVFPGLIVVLPVLADIAYDAPVLQSWPVFAASSFVCVALLYGLGNVVRAIGESIEPQLWRSWDGPPSTRYIRHRDRKFGEGIKAGIREAVSRLFGIELLSPDEEQKDRVAADTAIADSFGRVRPYLRQHDAHGLWAKHNIEYGFYRNLLGCRIYWVVIAALATVFAAGYANWTGQGIFNPATAVGVLALICAVYVGWFILPDATKRVADGYAESAWTTFLQLAASAEASKGD